MKIINKDLYKSDIVHYKCFLSNGVVSHKNYLSMVSGTAKQVKQLYPNVPLLFGKAIRKYYTKQTLGYLYNIHVKQDMGLVAFQTKLHYGSEHNIDIMRKSLDKLVTIAERNPLLQFGLPLPNIEFSLAKSIFSDLPINIGLYQFTIDI